MPLLNFHHIGLACKDIEKEIECHKILGYEIETPIFIDPFQKVKGIFLTNNNFRIEILAPLSNGSPLISYLTRGIKMYHQCYSCKDIDKTIRYLEGQGAKLLSPPVSAVAFNNRKIAFLILKTKMLIELVEGEGILLK